MSSSAGCGGDPDGDVDMAVPTPPPEAIAPSSSPHSLPSRLLSIVAAGELPTLPPDVATTDSNEDLDDLLTPFLPLLTRLQSSRRASAASHTVPKSTALDATLLRVEKASKWRQYAQVFADLTPSKLQAPITPDPVPAFRRFESGSAPERVMIVLSEWLLAAPGSLESSELFVTAIYQEEVAAILVQTLASNKLQMQQNAVASPLSILSVARKALNVPVGPVLLSRMAVNDPSSAEQLMDAIVAVVVDMTATEDKTMAQQEQDAMTTSSFVLENAQKACAQLAELTSLYAARLREKLSQQTTSLHCAAITFELLATATSREDVSVFLYQWLKRDGAPGSALRTYVQLASREVASGTTGEFQQGAIANMTKIRGLLLDTLDRATLDVSPYEMTAALGVCVGLQVLGSFSLVESERVRLLQSIDKFAPSSTSSRAITLAFIGVVLLWYPLAPALSKPPGQRDEHTKTAVTLSQQVLVTLFRSRDAGTGPLFVVSAVLFYTKSPALVPFLASVIGFDGNTCNATSTNAPGCGIQVQQALRAEYLHVFGDVILKPVLTESLLAREVLTFPPAARVSALDAAASGHGQHELTLRGLHGLLCEKSFLRHHHAHRLESWLATQVGEQAALPVHPLLVSVLLEWIENYIMAFEYPIAQAPRRLQLSIIPLRSSALAKWLAAPCLAQAYGPNKGQEHELMWARGVLGLTYALQFNQRLRHATMVAGSKLSSLASTSSVVSGASLSGPLGPGAEICLHYDLSAFPLRNIVTQALAHGDQGGAFEYAAPTLLKLMMEEHPQLFDAATASVAGTTLQLLPLAASPRDVAEHDLTSSWFRRSRKCGELPDVRVVQSTTSWTAVQLLLLELQSAPIEVVMRELPILVDGFLPYAVISSQTSTKSCRQVAAFCSQLAGLYETRARREQGGGISLLMRFAHALCFPDALWRQQQVQKNQGGTLQLLTYMQVLEEPFRLVDDAHDGVFRQPALLRVLVGLVRDARAAANVHVTKCDPSLVPVEGMAGAASATASVQHHQLLQDCLLLHGLLKRLLTLNSESSDDEVAEESRALLSGLVNELLVADAEASSPSPPRLVLAIHTQGYDTALVPMLVANIPAMKLLWDHWMAATSASSSSSSSSRSTTSGTKPLMEFVGEGAEKDLPKWRFRLRVVLSLCATHLSGSRQSAAMQQALRVVWNKLRNGVGSSGENSAVYVNLLGEVLPWIVDACSQNADLSAELVHFLLKLQRQQQGGSSSSKGRDGGRRSGTEATGKPQEQRQVLEQVLRDTQVKTHVWWRTGEKVMSTSAAVSRSEKVSAALPSGSRPGSNGAYVGTTPKSLLPTSPRAAEAVGRDGDDGSGSRLGFSIKSFRRKKHARERLHPLASESPRYHRHPHQQRHLSVAPTSPSHYGATPYSPRASKGAASPEDPDEEVVHLQRLHAHLSSDEAVQEWIRSYELERGNFASFAVFTEVKLDEVQETYVEQAGRPNAVEAAACCATLLKMPGIVGCYKTLLEKMSAGIQGAIYLPEVSLASTITDSTSPGPMAALVQKFYSRTPYFERVRELEKTLLISRSITDLNVLKAVTIDDVIRIFQYVPFSRVQAGIVKVYATDAAMLGQLITALQDQQGLLLLNRRDDSGVNDPDYPVHVPLATSAQICRAITHNAATFSSSGRDMILCTIVELIDTDSFREIYQHFGVHGKMCFLHHLSVTEGMDQLESVVDILPNAGESLFRLYLATTSGRVGDLSIENGPGGEPIAPSSPKDVFFSKLLSPEMEFFFVSDLAAYLTEAQWQLLSKEFERNENERKARRHRRAGIQAADFDIEIEEDTSDGNSSQPSAPASIDGFQMNMLNYLRHHNLSSAQLLQLVAKTFLSMLDEKEFSQLIDNCWARFSLDGQWSKALEMVQYLGIGESTAFSQPSSISQDVNLEYIAAIRLKMLKKIFMMLTREDRASWMDRVNAKYPTDSYKRKIQDLKDATTVALNTPPDLSDPAPHLSRMKAELKMRWLDAIMDCLLKEPESSARLIALKQALGPFANGNMPSPEVPVPLSAVPIAKEALQDVKPTLASAEKMLDQQSAADIAALLSKFAALPAYKTLSPVKEVVDRATCTSPVQELEQPTLQVSITPEIQRALKALVDRTSESQVLQLLRGALDSIATRSDTAGTRARGNKPDEARTANLSPALKHKFAAITAATEPIERKENAKVGCFDVGCQTNFENEQESPDTVGELEFVPRTTTPSVSGRETSRASVSPGRTAPLTLTALLGKSGMGTGTGTGKNKKERYQKINSVAVPRAVSGLITSWRMNTDQLVQFAKKSLANVLKIIADAYSEMITASRRKAQQQRLAYATPRGSGRMLTLSQIVYQSFLHSYGLPGIADMHLLAFSCAIETYRAQHLRVEYFARFCFEEVPKSQLRSYVEFLECIVSDDLTGTAMAGHLQGPMTTPASGSSMLSSSGNSRGMPQTPPGTSKRSRYVTRLNVPDKENWTISLDRAQEIAQLCFHDMRKSAVASFCDNLATIAAQSTSTAILPPPAAIAPTAESTSGDQVLNVDHLLQLVIAEWKLEQVRRERHLLDAFRAGDVNGDGQLTSAEFTQIVLSIDATRDMGDILLMYSDTLRRTECDQINPEVFLQVAREHELDRVVWQGDGDLFGVVNEVTDMEATWAHVRGFFVGTLEALARDLPPTHFLRVCEGAGCGCLKCVLDGYIGFQKMRREFALTQHQQKQPGNLTRRNSYVGVSSQLVWARFWHLMRQLHDAASESDGIATPWEGIRYIRDQPVLDLAPRSNSRRRDSLPNFLFPDTARITAKMSNIHNPEAFDAPTIHDQFSYLLAHMAAKRPDSSSRSS